MNSLQFLSSRSLRSITPIRGSLYRPSFTVCRYFSTGNGACLVIAEHDNKKLNSSTLNTITAAKQLGSVTVLVAGHFGGDRAVAKQVAKIDGVNKVIVADQDKYKNSLAEVYVFDIL